MISFCLHFVARNVSEFGHVYNVIGLYVRLVVIGSKIQDGERRPTWRRLNRYNSAADCPIFLKLGKWVHCSLRPQMQRLQNC